MTINIINNEIIVGKKYVQRITKGRPNPAIWELEEIKITEDGLRIFFFNNATGHDYGEKYFIGESSFWLNLEEYNDF